MKTRLQRTSAGLALVIPREMLEACHIGEEAEVSIQNGTLCVRAPGGKPWEDSTEAPAWAQASTPNVEDEDTLAYWSQLPEAPERPEVEPRCANQEALKEEAKTYGRPGKQGGA